MAMTILEAIRKAAETGAVRSKLGRWFAANHAEFAETLLTYRPRWEALVETFATEGLLTLPAEWEASDLAVRKTARRRTVEAARKTWLRVDAAKKVQAMTPTTTRTPTVTARAAAHDDDDADPDEPKIVRRPITRPQ
jgi:hypothetical protein